MIQILDLADCFATAHIRYAKCVLLTCHCEERSDAAISLYGYRFNEIATPSARDDNARDKPQFNYFSPSSP